MKDIAAEATREMRNQVEMRNQTMMRNLQLVRILNVASGVCCDIGGVS